jgi:hypothetical protein
VLVAIFSGPLEEGAAFCDETTHVALKTEALDSAPNRAERGVKADRIDHQSAAICWLESMLVMEPAEWPARLLVDESIGTVERRDTTRHPERDAEVPCPPCHLLAEANLAGRHAGDRPLARPGHRREVGVDVERQIEHDIGRRVDHGSLLEVDGHTISMPLVVHASVVPELGG